jgi:protein subunit release factor A
VALPFPGEILPSDLRVETYTPGVVSGFAVRRDYGVRITHLPTGVTVEHSAEHIQHMNKHCAMVELERRLRAAPEVPRG